MPRPDLDAIRLDHRHNYGFNYPIGNNRELRMAMNDIYALLIYVEELEGELKNG